MQVVFDFDDDSLFEITYQAFSSDGEAVFDLAHAFSFTSGGALGCALEDGVHDIADYQKNILSEIGVLSGESCCIKVCSTQPSVYVDLAGGIFSPMSESGCVVASDLRYIHKSTYHPLK